MRDRSKKKLWAAIAILLATIFWGVNYVAQSKASAYISPFTFNGMRMLMGFLTILPIILVKNKKETGKYQVFRPDDDKKLTIKGGVVAGCFLLAGISAQQIGIAYTTVGKAGFLSSLFVVMIPLIGLAMGQKVKLYQWIGIAIAVLGVRLLSVTEDMHINPGDLILILTAFLIALHVIASGHYNKQGIDSFQFTLVRFLTGIVICLVIVITYEGINIEGIKSIWPWVLYSGIFGSGAAFTLVALGQRVLDNISVSLIMSLESVFAALSGYFILNQSLTGREILGCILVFIAALGMNIYGEIQFKKENKEEKD